MGGELLLTLACPGGAIGSVAVCATGYSDRRVWVQAADHLCQVIAEYVSGTHSVFDGVLFKL